MKIVILDLEWNTAYYRQEQRFINEIIEFGAVKLNEKLRVIDTFQMFVKSQVSKRLRGMVKELTHISNEQLQQNGKDFATVINQFTRWAGKNTLILTWSNTDLYTLMDNCRCFLGDKTIPFLHQYADLQKYVQTKIGWHSGNQLGLSAAAEAMQISAEDIDLHRAQGDSLLCARILRQCYDKAAMKAMIQNADNTEFYDRFLFKPYPIQELNSPDIQPEDLIMSCIRCDLPLKRSRAWRKNKKGFESVFTCKNCGLTYTGWVQFYKLYDSVSVKRTLTQMEPEQIKPVHRRRRPKSTVHAAQKAQIQ